MLNNPISLIEDALNEIDTNLTTSSGTVGKIQYPFLFINDVSEVEFKYLKKQLIPGDLPLMVKADKGYAFITKTALSLNTVKHLSRFKDREIFLKETKDIVYPIEKVLDMLLLEE